MGFRGAIGKEPSSSQHGQEPEREGGPAKLGGFCLSSTDVLTRPAREQPKVRVQTKAEAAEQGKSLSAGQSRLL